MTLSSLRGGSAENGLLVGRLRHPGALIGLAVAVALSFWLLSDVLLLTFASILVGVGLRAPARLLQRHTGFPIQAGIAVLCLLLVALTTAFAWVVGPSLSEQLGQLLQQVNGAWDKSIQWFQDATWAHAYVDRIRSQMGNGMRTAAERILTWATSGIGMAGSLVVILITGLYLSLGPRIYVEGTVKLFPIERRVRVREILMKLGHMLELWLLGRLIDMVAVVAITFVGLWLLGTPLALALAVFAGVLNFVPYIGAVVGAVPAIIIAFSQSPIQALWVTILFVAIQTVEGYVLTPIIQKRTVDLPAALTILSQTAFGALFGFLGLLLAPALASVVMLVVRMAYVEDVLGDRPAK